MFADDIIWDIDLELGKIYEDAREELALPKCVKLPKHLELTDDEIEMGCADDPSWLDDIVDWLSDKYGYCVASMGGVKMNS